MKHQTFRNKRIIWGSKTFQIILVLGSFLFVAAAIIVHQQISVLVFWVAIILFGGGGLLTLRQLLNPNNIFIRPTPEVMKQIEAEYIQKKQEDLGVFTYDANGFTYLQKSSTTYWQWTDIESLFGYNISYYDDRYAADEVNLDIFHNSHLPITITQSTPGWHEFLNRLSENISVVPRNWSEKMAGPPFGKNLTLLYDKQGRAKEEVQKEYYPDKEDGQ